MLCGVTPHEARRAVARQMAGDRVVVSVAGPEDIVRPEPPRRSQRPARLARKSVERFAAAPRFHVVDVIPLAALPRWVSASEHAAALRAGIPRGRPDFGRAPPA